SRPRASISSANRAWVWAPAARPRRSVPPLTERELGIDLLTQLRAKTEPLPKLRAKTEPGEDAASDACSARERARTQPGEGLQPHEPQEVVVLDYGGQYSQLIARRVRECGVFSELLPHHVGAAEVARRKPKGVILSGGPASVYAD